MFYALASVAHRRNGAVTVHGRQQVERSIVRDIQVPNRGGSCKLVGTA